jgi:hypothetical protein
MLGSTGSRRSPAGSGAMAGRDYRMVGKSEFGIRLGRLWQDSFKISRGCAS